MVGNSRISTAYSSRWLGNHVPFGGRFGRSHGATISWHHSLVIIMYIGDIGICLYRVFSRTSCHFLSQLLETHRDHSAVWRFSCSMVVLGRKGGFADFTRDTSARPLGSSVLVEHRTTGHPGAPPPKPARKRRGGPARTPGPQGRHGAGDLHFQW